MLDYFVAGPTVSLRSSPAAPAWSGATPLLFAILRPAGEQVGRATVQLMPDHVAGRLDAPCGADGDTAALVEGARLLVRVCGKLSNHEIRLAGLAADGAAARALRADGFHLAADLTWRRPAACPGPARPKARSMNELYLDPYAVVWNFEPRPWAMLRPLVAQLQQTSRPRILEIGCGFGKNAVLLEELGFEVYGVDVSSAAIRLCRTWMRTPERFVQASAAALPFPDGLFDVVLDVGCLHCADHQAVDSALGEVSRVLKAGGRIHSRVLKPRGPAWLRNQLYETSRLGFSVEQVRGMFEALFDVDLWEDAHTIRIEGRKRL